MAIAFAFAIWYARSVEESEAFEAAQQADTGGLLASSSPVSD